MFFGLFRRKTCGLSFKAVAGMFRAVLVSISRMESIIVNNLEELQTRVNDLIAKQDEQAAKIDTLKNAVDAENENIRRAIELLGNAGDNNPAIAALIQTVTGAQERITRSLSTLTDTSAAVDTTAQALDDVVAPDPTITSFDPTSGPVGTVVTLLGTNLEGASVHVGSNACPVGNNTATSVEFVIPDEATGGGAITVTTANGSVTGGDFTVTTPEG